MTNSPVQDPEVTVVASPSIARLAAALSKFQGAMPTVPKSKIAKVRMKDGGSYEYKYADLADVTAAAMPILSANGLAFICRPEESGRGFILRGMLVHESGESIDAFLPIYGGDNQTIGGSLSYGRRYLLGALTGIVTDDDTDAQGVGDQQTQKSAARPRPKAKAPETPAPAPIADDSWVDKIGDASTFDELTAVYNEADRMNILGHMVGEETLKSRLYARRSELTA